LPDDVVRDSSWSDEGLFGRMDGERVDFLVMVGERGDV